MDSSKKISPRLEKELKLWIPDRRAYFRLCRLFPRVRKALIQKNSFHDTAGFLLRRHALALRLRNEDGKYFLTVKGPNRGRSLALVRQEVECRVAPAIARAFLRGDSGPALNTDPFRFIREAIPGGRFPELGWREICRFENYRKIIRVQIGGKPFFLELDKTRFGPRFWTYELEVEYQSAADVRGLKKFLEELFLKAGIPFQASPRSKFAHALGIKAYSSRGVRGKGASLREGSAT